MADEPMLNIRQASEHTGLPMRTIARAAKAPRPRLRGYKVSEFGPWFFTRADLDAWVESMDNTQQPATAGN